jgi:glucose-6-phosphate isomerase
METIKLNLNNILSFVNQESINSLKVKSVQYNAELADKNGRYNGFTGWLDLPSTTSTEFLTEIQHTTDELRKIVDILVVIGIGGSYLGAKAIISTLSGNFDNQKVIYAGINLSEEYLFELTEYLKDKNFGICVISKSGTTTEPAISFRILKEMLIKKVGKNEISKYIIAVTDKSKGALVKMAKTMGFKTYIIPDNIGGRFSVLTPVGLIPIAFAGFDIKQLIAGALDMEKATDKDVDFDNNIATKYAAARYALYKAGFQVEMLSNYNPKLHYVGEWWKQLYGESEGKEKLGIYPACADYTTDLHSMGQYVQDGLRFIFQTVLNVTYKPEKIKLNDEQDDSDDLNYLSGNFVEYVNQKAFEGTLEAHISGGVPNIIIDIPKLNEFHIGQLIYFFEKACGISAMLLEVHPFIQPGVEAYKSNMFRLLGKPSK